MSLHYAVMGNPIAHSLSPRIHHYFAQQTDIALVYEKIKVEAHHFSQQVHAFFSQDGKGLNVTLPFKQQAFAIAEQRSIRCQQAGAANTLWMDGGQLHADNTDGVGLVRDLNRCLVRAPQRILILGAGGAARGIISPLLATQPSRLVVANRTPEHAAVLQQDFPAIQCMRLDKLEGAFDLVINATSASLAGAFIALPQECMAAKPFCYDLSYQQYQPTAFVQYAQGLGCEAVDGLGMLVEQAAESFFIWHGILPETAALLHLLRS